MVERFTFEVLIMGNVVVIGSLNYDVSVYCESFPNTGETILSDSIGFSSGGKGGNQAVSAFKAGANTKIIGCIADDLYGKEIVKKLKEDGIDTSHLKISQKFNTGTALIEIDKEGNNRICVYPGANLDLNIEDLEKVKELIDESDVVLLQNELNIKTVIETIKLAKKQNKIVVYNPAPFVEIDDSILKQVDYIVPNQTELDLLTEKGKSLEEKVDSLLLKGVKNVVVTLGKDGVYYKGENGVITLSALKVDVVDTVGAGDCFCGYLAACISDKNDIMTSLKISSVAASIKCTKKGAQNGTPQIKEVKDFISKR